jgi:hypothetical protein
MGANMSRVISTVVSQADLAELDDRYIKRNPDNGSFRTDANGQHLQLEADNGKFQTLINDAGAVSLGPEVD